MSLIKDLSKEKKQIDVQIKKITNKGAIKKKNTNVQIVK